MTREMMIQLVQALSHSNVYIDNVAYTKSSIETEGSLEESNLYVVTARMLKTRGAFAESSDVFNTGNMEIPALIDMDGGFVKYQ
jgi:hypothetical protein